MATNNTDNQAKAAARDVKNVIVVGAGGRSGKHMTAALLKTGKHTVTALTRPSSQNTFAPDVKVIKADYSDHSSLVAAMQGQDALVITMSNAAATDAIAHLVEAAIAAHVPWILPNEWGYDYLDQTLNADLSDFGLGTSQLAIRRLIETKGAPHSSYVAVACGFWYDYSLGAGPDTLGFDFASKTLTQYGDGSVSRYFSTLPYCGEAVARILSLPVDHDGAAGAGAGPCLQDYRNQIVRVRSFTACQRDMLESVVRVTGGNRDEWTVHEVDPRVRFEEARVEFRAGTWMAARRMLYARAFYPGSGRSSEDEDGLFQDGRLGLEPVSLDEATREVVKEIGMRDA